MTNANPSDPTADLAASPGHAPTLDRRPLSASMSGEEYRESPGTHIGPYKLVKLIGEGGFGTVFMAEQERPVARTVALKIIKLGMDTRQVVARFEQERQALAMMDHPNIARVVNAGATETGRPYFVMDFVKGDPIGEYCDANNLTVEQRLDLLTQVCNAVQHAHTKGIIHRDIKPSNILVSTQDGVPHAKVIDFGIAKATGSKLTEKTLFTEHRQLIGTPEYMSPEQAEGSLDIDTRTDVYSLGVLLYELLTGCTPFSGTSLRTAAYGEIQRIIREVDPPRPSTRLSQIPGTAAGVAGSRRVEPRRLNATLRGELDWIVMKAMDKDRQRRYQTPSALALDIGRFLSGDAVVAAPPSKAYRFRKLVRRNKGVVLAGSLVAAALVLGMVGTTIGLVDANRQRAAAETARVSEVAQRELAEASAQKAIDEAARAARAEVVARDRLEESEATVEFLDGMLGAVDPQAQGKDVTVRAVLDQASGTLASKFAQRPLVAARLHGTIGRTYMGLGVYDRANPHIREALATRLRELGPSHEDTCRAANELGGFLIKSGEHAEAEAVLQQALADHERLFGRHHDITVGSMDQLATLYVVQSRSNDAASLLDEVLRIRTASLGPEHVDTLGTMNSLALLYTETERFEEAEKLFESAIVIQDRRGGPDHPVTLDLKANLAWLHYWYAASIKENSEAYQERLRKARELGEPTLEARIRVLGEDHQATLASMANLAIVYKALEMPDRAEELQRKDLEISLRMLGESHPDTITSLANLGNSFRERRRFEEALPYFERALVNARKSNPPDHPGTAFILGWYGSSLRELGRYSDAEPHLIDARGIIGRVMGESHAVARQMSRGLAQLYEGWEKTEPGKGYGKKGEEWKGKIEESK